MAGGRLIRNGPPPRLTDLDAKSGGKFVSPARSKRGEDQDEGRKQSSRFFPTPCLLRREEKHQRPPGAQPPVELIVLAGLRFLPFVPTQSCLFNFRLSQRLQIHVVFQVHTGSPPDSTQLRGHSVRVIAPVIASREITGAAVEVNSDWLRFAAVGPQHVRQKMGSLN